MELQTVKKTNLYYIYFASKRLSFSFLQEEKPHLDSRLKRFGFTYSYTLQKYLILCRRFEESLYLEYYGLFVVADYWKQKGKNWRRGEFIDAITNRE